jgi:hypothetical protein
LFLRRPDRDALLKSIHEVVEKADVVKEGWNGYNVIHDNASRVAALDIGFAPRCVIVLAAQPSPAQPRMGSLVGRLSGLIRARAGTD